MSAMLALGLLHYGLVAFQPAHMDAQPMPPAAGFSIRLNMPHTHTHHMSGTMHVHTASPFVLASVNAVDAAREALSVAYVRLQATRIATRGDAPPLPPPRPDL